jgi:hypothetical protein
MAAINGSGRDDAAVDGVFLLGSCEKGGTADSACSANVSDRVNDCLEHVPK